MFIACAGTRTSFNYVSLFCAVRILAALVVELVFDLCCDSLLRVIGFKVDCFVLHCSNIVSKRHLSRRQCLVLTSFDEHVESARQQCAKDGSNPVDPMVAFKFVRDH
jgi:hypothetical protein